MCRRFLSIRVGSRRPTERQVVFAFRARTVGLERTLKRLIVLGTAATLALLLVAFPMGRFWTRWLVTRARWLAMSSIGAVRGSKWNRRRMALGKGSSISSHAHGALEQHVRRVHSTRPNGFCDSQDSTRAVRSRAGESTTGHSSCRRPFSNSTIPGVLTGSNPT